MSGDTYSDGTFKYDGQGRLIQYKRRIEGACSYKYDQKGRIASEKSSWYSFKFKYDKHNNVKSRSDGKWITTFPSKYKNGRIVKQADGHGIIWTYRYKKMNVPTKDVSQIMAQQRSILMYDRAFSMDDVPLEGWYK